MSETTYYQRNREVILNRAKDHPFVIVDSFILSISFF